MDAKMLNLITKVVKKGDYLYGVCKENPNASKRGYVLLHRLIVENSLGRYLTSDEIVHHKDKNKKNNSLDNLEVTSQEQHAREHGLERRVAHLTHGTLSAYRYCKCELCRAAKAAWQRNYMKNRK